MDSPRADQIELLTVMLVDLRATIDAEKRAIVNAQASAEEYRIARDRQSLADIEESLAQVTDCARVLTDGLTEANRVLKAVRRAAPSSSNPPESSAV